jgi:hypothetical protein
MDQSVAAAPQITKLNHGHIQSAGNPPLPPQQPMMQVWSKGLKHA